VARAAAPVVADELRSGQRRLEVDAQRVEQRRARLAAQLLLLAVDVELDLELALQALDAVAEQVRVARRERRFADRAAGANPPPI